MSDSNLDVALVAGLGAGLYFFFKGFRVYREFRVLEDTPEIPIRSIPMGLVHIHGKALGDQRVKSPVSGTPCFFYKVDIEKWQTSSKGGGSWSHYKTDATGVPFYLQDASGKVLLNAHGAEYDLMQSAKRETRRPGSGFGRLLSGMGASTRATDSAASDDSLVAYAESVAVGSTFGSSFVLGSLAQVAISGSVSIGLSGGSDSSRRYRFTEYCILPDHWYDVIGTCAENPAQKDEHDRNIILKGQNEPTFLISFRAEKDVEKALRNKAVLHVFGGGALAVVCLGILLAKLGWL